MSKKKLTILVGALSAGVLALTGGGIAAYASVHKDVTLALDGQDKTVSTFSGTVGDLLKSQDIAIGEHDIVSPGLSDRLEDGERIVVQYGRQLNLTVDGEKQSYWVTARTVKDALSQAGLRFEGADLSASRSAGIGRDGLSLKVLTQKDVTVVSKGKKRHVTTTGLTVADALSAAKVKVDGNDKISRKLTARITDGSRVKVVKVDVKTTKVTSSIAYETVRKADSSMYKGEEETQQSGKSGTRVSVVKTTYFDGKKHARKVISSKVTEKPVDAIVLYGTKVRSTGGGGDDDGGSGGGGGGGTPGGGGLNWAALAQCESGGNPRIISSNGLYYGLYQFSLSTWASVGGSGLPSNASPSEQTYRAQILYSRAGSSPWPVCGHYLYS